MATEETAGQQIGMTALLALLAAIAGVIAVFVGQPGGGLVFAICAAVLGAIGFFMSASPRVSGGMISIVAIVIGVFGIGLSVLGVIGSAIF